MSPTTDRLLRVLLSTALALLLLDVAARATGAGSASRVLAQFGSVIVTNTVTVNVDDASVEDPLGELAGSINSSVLDVNVKQVGGAATAASPCLQTTVTTDPISVTADTVIIAKHATKKTYICNLLLVATTAETVSIIEGDGTTCANNRAALAGSTTDASGMAFGATGGVIAVAGDGVVLNGKTANRDVCLNVSTGGVRVAGWVTWAQQ